MAQSRHDIGDSKFDDVNPKSVANKHRNNELRTFEHLRRPPSWKICQPLHNGSSANRVNDKNRSKILDCIYKCFGICHRHDASMVCHSACARKGRHHDEEYERPTSTRSRTQPARNPCGTPPFGIMHHEIKVLQARWVEVLQPCARMG